jgi:hypothetical protein
MVLLLIACGVVLASSGKAQTISVVSNLSFGNVYPSVPKVVSKYAAGAAAEFHVSGTAGAEVQITFLYLPTYINQSGFTLSVLFSNTDCAMDSSATPSQSNPGFDNQNPWQPIIYRLGMNGLTIWLGASAIPNIGQKPGSYTGPIQVRVQYTGN